MPKSPEQFYEQHRKDAERVEKAESTYDKHLEEARGAGDLTKYPELWDQASAEYQAEAKEKIAEAVKAGNYDVAEELIRGLRTHLDTNKEIEERGKREGLNKEDWELYQSYREHIASLISEISDPLTKKKMLRKSALLFDKTGSMDYEVKQQIIECSLLALELEKAANQEGVRFSVSTFRNPKEMTVQKPLSARIDTQGMVKIIKNLEIRDGEGPTEESEHLEKVFAELSAQAEKDGEEYPKDIIYFTDGETSNPRKTRETLEKLGKLVNVEIVVIGGASKETAGFYRGIEGVRVSVVPKKDELPFAFGEILKARYAPELLVGEGKEEISLSEAEQVAAQRIEKMAEINPKEEIQRMVSENDWNHAKDKVLGRIDRSKDLSQFAEMRTFDPEKFDAEFDMERLSGRIREIVRREEGNPIYYLLTARDLKLVSRDQDLFLKEVSGLILEKAVKEIRQRKHYPREFIVLASALKDIDPEKFQQISGDVSDAWQQMVRFIKEMPPVYRPYYMGLAQNIKPDSEPDLTIDERTWKEYKQELDHSLHREYAFGEFFRAANKVSYLKLEGEK